MNKLKIIFLGTNTFSRAILLDILSFSKETVEIKAVFSIPKLFNISYSETAVKNYSYANLEKVANKNSIDYYELDNRIGNKISSYKNKIASYSPDIILAIGWYYMVPESVRRLAKLGAWGIHASLLPKYAGGAPLVWAMIKGESQTGVSLFRMENGVDDGDIIRQEEFEILPDDTIKEVYSKAIKKSILILREVFQPQYKITYTSQNKSEIEVFPQRSPQDGLIDWSKSSKELKDFIRAQTKPYPGAYFIYGNKKVTVWDASIEEI